MDINAVILFCFETAVIFSKQYHYKVKNLQHLFTSSITLQNEAPCQLKKYNWQQTD